MILRVSALVLLFACGAALAQAREPVEKKVAGEVPGSPSPGAEAVGAEAVGAEAAKERDAAERQRAREELAGELDTTPTQDAETGMGAMLVRTFVVLGIVVLSIYLTLNFGLRRLMGLRAPTGKGGLITVVERVPLDQRRALFVIKAANEYLLVGGGDGNLNLICKLSSEEVDQLRAQQLGPTNVMSPFLEKLLLRKDPRKNPPT